MIPVSSPFCRWASAIRAGAGEATCRRGPNVPQPGAAGRLRRAAAALRHREHACARHQGRPSPDEGTALPPDEEDGAQLQCKKFGVLVREIDNESILEEDSLLPGDLIYQVNEMPITDLESFERAIKSCGQYAVFYVKKDKINLITGVKLE